MDWSGYLLLIFLIAAAFFVVAACLLWWSVRQGHFQNFDNQAKSIFNEEEPEGVVIDEFPDRR